MIESGSARKYLIYAVGEIALVVIGILIALWINNWNERRKAKVDFHQSMMGLAEEIMKDTTNFQLFIDQLAESTLASNMLISVLELESEIEDSLKFMANFVILADGINIQADSEVWDEIRRSGVHKRFADPAMIQSIQEYYGHFTAETNNWNFAQESVLEMRRLKYKLWTQSDLNQIRILDPPQIPSDAAFDALFNEPKVVELCKVINFVSIRWQGIFQGLKDKASGIITSIEREYSENTGL